MTKKNKPEKKRQGDDGELRSYPEESVVPFLRVVDWAAEYEAGVSSFYAATSKPSSRLAGYEVVDMQPSMLHCTRP